MFWFPEHLALLWKPMLQADFVHCRSHETTRCRVTAAAAREWGRVGSDWVNPCFLEG